MADRADWCHTYETLSLFAFNRPFSKILNLSYDVIMTSSKFKSEITREPYQIDLIAIMHTKPCHFVHLLGHLQNFRIHVMTSL